MRVGGFKGRLSKSPSFRWAFGSCIVYGHRAGHFVGAFSLALQFGSHKFWAGESGVACLVEIKISQRTV